MYVNGAKSSPEKVTSGIPQGSVLGPVLFVMYINDLSENILSNLYMFADDTKIFRAQKSEYDHKCLQNDLETLENWSKKWSLSFHPDKCIHMHLSRFPRNETRSYKLFGQTLGKSDCEKDLGVYIDSELSFEKHISEKVENLIKVKNSEKSQKI